MTEGPWIPRGSEILQHYAMTRRFGYEARPDERWFRHWEPYDTMVSPEFWFNACTERTPFGTFVLAEPWTAGEGLDPIERTVVGFAQFQTPMRRAAIRVGEPFLTKVVYIEAPPPPQVKIGEPIWDEHVKTFARSPEEALQAFPPRLRELLRQRGFRGHLEIRPGGLIVHHEGLQATPNDYEATLRMTHEVVHAVQHPF